MTTRYTHAEWLAEAERRFGSNMMHWRFVCPACGHEWAIEDFRQFKAQGITPNTAFQNCIGRFDGHIHVDAGTKPGPCNYTGNGLINLCPVIVVADDGKEVCVFDFAPAIAAAAPELATCERS